MSSPGPNGVYGRRLAPPDDQDAADGGENQQRHGVIEPVEATDTHLSLSLIEVRTRANLTQAELAERMKTTPSVVARLEGGRARPSARTLEKIARATGARLRISFDPA